MNKQLQDLNIEPVMPTQKEAFWYWFKLGFISFGGPAGQIAIMHHDLVENKRWISEERFLHALNFCMVLPGPEAQQLATYIGWLMHKTTGGVVAGVLFILPSLFILILLSFIYVYFGQQPVIAGILYGIKPAVVAIVFFAAYRIGCKVLTNKAFWGIAITAFLAITFLKIPFPFVVILAAITGFVVNHYVPSYFAAKALQKNQIQQSNRAVIDRHTPTYKHTIFNKKTAFKFLLIGLGIWLIAMIFLSALFGQNAALTQMGWFFTKAALLTFGGAYAVLPYVFQGAVVHYQWLSAAQMMDGLALGETTPGPLIMVVAFVGFLGGWNQPFIGDGNMLVSAILAALVVTLFTFLPSFIFIFVGAPLIESTQKNVYFHAPLAAITAAVVGVIVSLAVFFGQQIFWPNSYFPLLSSIDWFAFILALTASVALIKYKLSTIKVITTFALLGLLHQFLI